MYELLTTPAVQQATWKTRLHQIGQNLHFTPAWKIDWAAGKFFRIKEAVLVPWDRGFIIPGNDHKDLDLSNAPGGLLLYPEAEGIVYEILIGLKPGNYQVGVYIPGPRDYLLALADASAFPDLADPERRYLAAITPEDSPYGNPLLKIWALADQPKWILKTHVRQGVSFEKCIISFRVNKLRLEEIPQPAQYTVIKWFEEIKGNW